MFTKLLMFSMFFNIVNVYNVYSSLSVLASLEGRVGSAKTCSFKLLMFEYSLSFQCFFFSQYHECL